MYLLFIVAVPWLALFTAVYLFLAPAGTSLKGRVGFESGVLVVLIGACVAASAFSHETVGRGTDSAWWPIIAFLYSMMAIPVVLGLAGIVRALVYRSKEASESTPTPSSRLR